MLAVAFIHWWYGPGWKDTAQKLQLRMRHTALLFSLPILLTTMFAPWKRIVTYPGKSIGERFRAVIDNLISRVVGFIVRLGALLACLTIIGLYAVIGGFLLLLWPVIPLLGPVLIVAGLI
jgi:hypothetical protein